MPAGTIVKLPAESAGHRQSPSTRSLSLGSGPGVLEAGFPLEGFYKFLVPIY